MTFEEYSNKYPEFCSGCSVISFVYDYHGSHNFCRVFAYSDDAPKDCPCRNCLIKIKCEDDCEPVTEYLAKLKDYKYTHKKFGKANEI